MEAEKRMNKEPTGNDKGRVDMPGFGLRPVPQLKVDEVTVDFDREKPEGSLKPVSDEERQKQQIPSYKYILP